MAQYDGAAAKATAVGEERGANSTEHMAT